MGKARRKSPQHRWTRDREKEEYWLRQMALWQESGLSVRAFCKEYSVVETSFYAWRRELIIRTREASPEDSTNSPSLTPNKLRDARGREIAIRFRQTEDLQGTLRAENAPGVSQSIRTKDRENAVKIITPSGYQIFVTQHSSLDLLESVLCMLRNHLQLAPLNTVANSENEHNELYETLPCCCRFRG